MIPDGSIFVFDVIGTAGFLVAAVLGLLNLRDSDVARMFWVTFVFVAALGSLWLGLVAVEWLGIESQLMDVFSTSLQAVVIAVFAIGAVGARATVEDLERTHARIELEKENAIIARQEAHERRYELEQTQELLHEVEKMADIGGWELECENGMVRWTDGTHRIFGTDTDAELSAEDSFDFYHPSDRDRIASAVEDCRETGQSYELEARIISADGRERWVRTSGQRTTVDGQHLLRGTIQDITLAKEREQRLMVLNRILRHNLRNKVSIINGYAETLEDELEVLEAEDTVMISEVEAFIDELETEAQDYREALSCLETVRCPDALDKIERITSSAETLLSITERARDFEQAVEAERQSEPVAIRPLCEELRGTFTSDHPEATIEATVDTYTVEANPHTLRMAISELVENAIKHNDAESPTVCIESVPTADDDRVGIRIRDDGPGIPSMERQVLELGEESPLSHGSGLGLWTVNWLMARLGASIEITTGNGDGTTVTMFLPIEDAGQSHTEPSNP